VDVDPVRRRFPSSTDEVRLAGRDPTAPVLDGRPSEMALRRDSKAIQTNQVFVAHAQEIYVW